MQQKVAGIKVNLSEIFTSIEGEGIFFGTKTMFVRLAGCPLHCHWCDTPYALPLDSGTEYPIDEVKKMIAKNLYPNTFKVNFTGGEPLIQHEAVIELAKFVKANDIKTYIESACYDSIRFSKVLPYFDICKVEFKTRDSKAVDSRHYDNLVRSELECLIASTKSGKMTYVKIVVTNSTSLKDFERLVSNLFTVIKSHDLAGFIIQPSNRVDEPTLEKLFGFYDAVYPFYNQVRIVPQLHKLIRAK